MWRILYNGLLILVFPVVVGILLAKPRCRRGLPQRLGMERSSSGWFGLFGLSGAAEADKPNKLNKPDKPVIWIHAVSLGEVVAVSPLVKALAQRHPGYRYVVTTVTETGREAVEQRLAGVAEHRYAPLDLPWAVSRMVKRLAPELYIFVETELWPNLLWALQACGTPAVLVNGRLSSRSFQRQDWPLLRDFYRSVVSSLALCLMQSARDAERMLALGARPERVHVTGNIKFDQPLPAAPADGSWRKQFGLDDRERLFLAGSTHPGEEEQVIAAYGQLVRAHPSLVLMLAPRHIERAERLEAVIREAGFRAVRKSRLNGIDTGPRVVILDTRGELARAYREAAVAYVGGTLVPVGGHNLLEPAVWGTPVLFGPHTDHCAEIAMMLLQTGGARRVTTAGEIAGQVRAWLDDQAARDAAGEAAKQVVLENQGALQRSLDLIASCLNRSAASVPAAADAVADSAGARR